MLMDFTLWTKTPIHLDKIPVKAKINTLNSSNPAAVEAFSFAFQDHFPLWRTGPPSWKTLTEIPP